MCGTGHLFPVGKYSARCFDVMAEKKTTGVSPLTLLRRNDLDPSAPAPMHEVIHGCKEVAYLRANTCPAQARLYECDLQAEGEVPREK